MTAALWLALCAAEPALRPLAAPDLETPVLALTLVGEDELVALSPGSVTHYHLDGLRLTLAARLEVEPEGPAVRFPAGLLRSEAGARSVWALASGWPSALLLDLDARLHVRSEADAMPWPGTPAGVRFRPGTSLLEADLPALGAPPFLALAPGAALDRQARLHRAQGPPVAVAIGTPLASLPGGGLLAGSATPGSDSDALIFLSDAAADPCEVRSGLPGALRALAVAPRGHGRLFGVLALDGSAGAGLFAVALGTSP